MYRQFMESQLLDISRDRMDVAPTAHYSMGGIVVEPETHATDVAGLYAAGEVSSGVHGSNRLGGNTLVETLVLGRRAGDAAAAHSQSLRAQRRDTQAIAKAYEELNETTQEGEQLARPLQRDLRNNMWENCGVVRAEAGLKQNLERLASIRVTMADLDVRPSSEGNRDLALALDLRGAVVAAEATLRSAIERRESRGAHQSKDFPSTDPRQTINFVTRADADGSQLLSSVPVASIPDSLTSWVTVRGTASLEGRLLE